MLILSMAVLAFRFEVLEPPVKQSGYTKWIKDVDTEVDITVPQIADERQLGLEKSQDPRCSGFVSSCLRSRRGHALESPSQDASHCPRS